MCPCWSFRVHTYIRFSRILYACTHSPPLVCRELGLIYIPTVIHTGFVGQCDETSITYCILGYRVYRIGIIILIVSAWLPPDTATTYSCILTTKNIQKNFQKRLDFGFVFVYTYASSNEPHKTK